MGSDACEKGLRNEGDDETNREEGDDTIYSDNHADNKKNDMFDDYNLQIISQVQNGSSGHILQSTNYTVYGNLLHNCLGSQKM